jgi:hypothetical protein
VFSSLFLAAKLTSSVLLYLCIVLKILNSIAIRTILIMKLVTVFGQCYLQLAPLLIGAHVVADICG